MSMDQLGSLAIGAAPTPAGGVPTNDTGTHDRLDSIITLLTHIDGDFHALNTAITGTTNPYLGQIVAQTSSLDGLLTHIDGDLHGIDARLASTNSLLADISTDVDISRGVLENININRLPTIIANQTNGTQRTVITDGTNNANLGLGNVDAMPNSNYGVFTNSRSFIYGGAGAWDRVRSVQIGNNTIGTGLLAAGAWAQLPNGNYSAILLDANRKMDIRPLTAAVDTVTVSGFVQPAGGFAQETTLQSVLTQVTAINANTDTVEALLTTANGSLTTIIGHVDGLETLIGTTNTNLSTIIGHVDGLEALVTATNAALATLNAKDFATQTTLAALNAKFNSLGQKTMANSHPVVLASDQSAIPVTMGGSTQVFTRIKNRQFLDTEEVRYDIPAALASSFIYTGLATIGTATATASWFIVRTSFDANGNPSRDQYRTGVSWDNRAAGW